MDTSKFRRIKATAFMVLVLAFSAFAQNKDIDKGNDLLKKAMDQTDAAKRQDFINRAIESYTKGGMKKEMYVLIGDAFLEKKDYTNASSNYSRCDKEQKKEGMKKIAEYYVNDAFEGEAKNEAKNLKKAMDFYTKGDAAKEGARVIGDRFYEKGMDFYPRAIEYYVLGESAVKLEQVAKEYFAKGGDSEVKAAETYLKMKSPDGFKNGGDIYYNRKEYGKAIEAYIAGAYQEGIHKYADLLYAEHRDDEADNLIMRLADAYTEKKNDDAVEKLATQVMGKGSYLLASKLYDKAGNVNLGDKCRAYDAIIGFRLDEAKGLFTNVGDAASAKMITDNEKVLWPLKDLADNFDELQKLAPFVNLITDSVTGRSYPSPSDQKTQEDYYKSIREQIIKNTFDLSAKYATLTDANLKKFIRKRFTKYGAVRSILDPETFSIKKQKQDIKIKDVVL